MISEASFIDVALRSWKANLDRAGTFFGALSEEELQRKVAPGKNRLIYLWGHLAAASDRMVAVLGFAERLHPELAAMFVSNPDKTVHGSLDGTATTTGTGSMDSLPSFQPSDCLVLPFRLELIRLAA